MPSVGKPSCSTFGSHTGAAGSYTELGPPESTSPTGSSLEISSTFTLQGRMEEKTCSSRIRRAINWVYWPPKSRTTIPFRVTTVPPLCRFVLRLRTPLFQNNVDEFPWHHHRFHDLLPAEQ